MNKNEFLNILSVTATSSSIGYFFCGLQICNRIRRLGTTEGTSIAPFWITSLSCIFWLGYGKLRNDDTIIFVNIVGLIFQSMYFIYYYIYTRIKTFLNKLILLEIFLCFFTYCLVSKNSFIINDLSTKENFIGIICFVLNIATTGSPLVDIV